MADPQVRTGEGLSGGGELRAPLGKRAEVRTPHGTLAYWSRGDGPPIVFLHGIGVNALLWRKVIPPLAEGHRCIALELPLGGHDVPMPRAADLTPTGLADLVAGFLDALDLRDVTLVGSDTGGGITQIVATRSPERIGRLVLGPSDAFEDFLPKGFRYLQALAWVPSAPFLTSQSMRIDRVRRLSIGYGKLTRRPIPREVLEAYSAPARRSAVRRDLAKVLRGIRRRYTIEAGAKLREFRRPALIVWAKEDPVFRYANAERLARTLSDARLETIEDSYGFVSEDQPERFASLIGSFVDEERTPAP